MGTNDIRLLQEIRDGILNNGGSSNLLQEIKDSLVNPNFSAVAIETLVAGNCVYMNATGKVGKASSSSPVFSKVIGLAIADAYQDFVGTIAYSGSHLDLSNWTAIIGTRYLSPGAYYYLDVFPGRLTKIAPTTPSLYLVVVGQALSPTNLKIEIQPSVLL
jgi:hypothetical protein